MSYVLLGSGCKQICGCTPRRRASRKKSTSRRQKPAYLKYVRYHPNTVVTPGWDGRDVPAVVPRIPAYWTYAGAVARRNARRVVVPASGPQTVGVAVVPVSRKRKLDG
ncbi:hypothetical protein SPSAdV-1_gp02 [Skua adenovirus 1]|uniref:Uncharacterized protein n=1 Tax=South Polar skua adenovirus 1 TaxID=2848087 RepID=G9B6J6_9ADEN|nr:hypothetical protein SPSAdV-1_gp02 [Skua adenovirus 1]ADP30812.1 hypothetical protein [Skua adenovirus 1]